MRTILFTNARDEHNILEWVVHHLNIGFQHIHIVDHMSAIPLSTVLKNIPRNRLTIKRIDRKIMKTTLMREAYICARRNKYMWMLYLDCDEFLILNNDADLNLFLKKYDVRKYAQIGINWLMFGTNDLLDTPAGTIIENYTKCDAQLDRHIKSFLCPYYSISSIPNPHVFILPDMSRSVGVDRKQLDRPTPWWRPTSDDYRTVDAYIAHYTFQSYSRYIERKILLPTDDTNTFRDRIPPDELHRLYNQHVNMEVRRRYNEKNILLIERYTVDRTIYC